jgi:hypothetical protein
MAVSDENCNERVVNFITSLGTTGTNAEGLHQMEFVYMA